MAKVKELLPGHPVKVRRFVQGANLQAVSVWVEATFIGWHAPGQPIVKYKDDTLHTLHNSKDMEY